VGAGTAKAVMGALRGGGGSSSMVVDGGVEEERLDPFQICKRGQGKSSGLRGASYSVGDPFSFLLLLPSLTPT
jgi:hypothetical protein